jgi:hypothetical protein
MPTDVIQIARVDATATTRPDLTRYLVTGTYADARLGGFQAYTLDAFQAALCERAGLTHQCVAVTWRDSRYGKDLVEVELT